MRTRRASRTPKAYTAAQVLALAPTAWWKADDLALADGDTIASWTDASGNGWTLTQSTSGKRPTFDTDGINGHPAMRGNATAETALTTAAMPAMPGPYTVVVAGKAPTTTPAATQYVTGGSSGVSRRDVYFTTNRVFGLQGSVGTNGSVTAPPDIPFVVTGIFDAASSLIRHDSAPTAGTSGDTGTGSPIKIKVGARHSETLSFDGWIGEVLFFPGRLSEVDVRGIELYLSDKWDISLTPPGVVYVDGDTGSDTANTGRSPSSPLKTVTIASEILGVTDGRIEVAGTLRELLALTGAAGARLVRLAENVEWYASERHTSGWASVGGGIYSKAVAGYDTSVTHARVVTDAVEVTLTHPVTGETWTETHWATLTPAAVATTPAQGEIGFTASTLYVRLPGDADPNTKTIEVPKFSSALFSSTAKDVVLRGKGDAMPRVLCANRGNITAGSFGTDGRITTYDIDSRYGGDGCFRTQNDATYLKRYRCRSRLAVNDGNNLHGTPGRRVLGYSEDCDDAFNGDEGESAHDAVEHIVRGGWKHHNVTGGGITDVGQSTLDADGSAAGPLVCEENRASSSVSAVADQGGISAYEADTVAMIGPEVICRDNKGSGIFINPGSVGSSVAPAAAAASTGNDLPDTIPA